MVGDLGVGSGEPMVELVVCPDERSRSRLLIIVSVFCEDKDSSAGTGVGLAPPTTAMVVTEKKKLARVKNCMLIAGLVESGEGF